MEENNNYAETFEHQLVDCIRSLVSQAQHYPEREFSLLEQHIATLSNRLAQLKNQSRVNSLSEERADRLIECLVSIKTAFKEDSADKVTSSAYQSLRKWLLQKVGA